MNELTYQDETGNEFYINQESIGDRNVIDIYTYSDTQTSELNISEWVSHQNPVFIHCPKHLLDEVYMKITRTMYTEDND